MKKLISLAEAHDFIVWARNAFNNIGGNLEQWYITPTGNDVDENGKMKTYTLEQLYEIWSKKQ